MKEDRESPYYTSEGRYIGLADELINLVKKGKGHSYHPDWEYDRYATPVMDIYNGVAGASSDLTPEHPMSLLGHELGHAATLSSLKENMNLYERDTRNIKGTWLDKIKDSLFYKGDNIFKKGFYYTDFSPEFRTGVFNTINSARLITGHPLDTPESIYSYLSAVEKSPYDVIDYYQMAPDEGRLLKVLYHLRKRNAKTADKFKRAIAFYGSSL